VLWKVEDLHKFTVLMGRWLAAASCVITMIIMLLQTADVLGRKLFGTPVLGTYDITTLLIAPLVSFGIGYAHSEGAHVRVEFLVRILPQQVRRMMAICTSLLSLTFFILLTWRVILYGMKMWETGSQSLTIRLPIFPSVYSIALGCAVLCVLLVMDVIQYIKGTKET
jgi:TRAP-type C4-dicarboxylate transport system permease small subunit